MIELLVVMAILGVLAAAVLPLAESVVAAQKERELRAALWQIRDAIDEYKRAADAGRVARVTESGYPPNLNVLASGVPDARPGYENSFIYFLRRLPRDPFADPRTEAAATWRTRSYASPPDRPAAGSDIFDVRSGSDQEALDGSRYSTW